ncbi:recombinase family protein [Candidatus Avoscillospira sp. LCP25S3_F1]|uniref:recombinase family protein n=1 Tax=Candidatus Avoscillospira sp. LCP25S3_F1 TaxID=3438825 RepID=UPI003F8F1510
MSPTVQIAAAYIRVSTADQTEYSPDAQRHAIEKWAGEHGYLLPPQYIYVDEGISGRTAEKRPAFQAMIAAAKSREHPFDAILVHKFDRFARSREDSVVYKSLLRKKNNVRVISITESIEDDRFSVILEAMLEAMAEYYSINLAHETKKGMTEAAHRGVRQCVPSFGYHLFDKKMVPHPEESVLVQKIFRDFINGKAYKVIAEELNAMGVRTHRGSRFENRTIEYILRNPVYIGKLRWNPSGKTRRDYDNKNIILADADHTPIIDQDTWDAAQEMVRHIKSLYPAYSKPNYARHHWLIGIVRCASCGGSMVWTKPNALQCGSYARGSCTTTNRIIADKLASAVLERLAYDADHATAAAVVLHQSPTASRSQRSVLETQISATERKLSRLRDAYLIGAETPEEYLSAKTAMEQELQEYRHQLAALDITPDPAATAAALRSKISEVLSTLQAPDETIAKKHDALKSIVQNMTFNREQNLLTMVYRLSI